MILDQLNEFCEGATTSAATGKVVATAGTPLLVGDVIDLGNTTNYPGTGTNPLYLVIMVTTQIITAGTAGTITFNLMSDSTADLDAGSSGYPSGTIHLTTTALTTDDATAINVGVDAGTASYVGNQTVASATAARMAKYTPVCVVPLPGGAYERYLGIVANAIGQNTTAGAVRAFLTATPNQWFAKPDGI